MAKDSNILLIGLAVFLGYKLLGGAQIGAAGMDAGGGGGGGGGGDNGATSAEDIGYNEVQTSVRSQTVTGGAPSARIQSNAVLSLSEQARQRYGGLSNIPLNQQTIRLANAGALKQSTYQSIVGYAQVKASGGMGAYNYAGGAAAMPNVDPIAYDAASVAFQTSPATIQRRALSWYSSQTAAHRGAMDAGERSAWDSTNLQAALNAYKAAGGYTGK